MRSAEINQRYYPQQNFPHLVALAAAMDACGFIIAHTGTVAGLLFRSCQTINDDGVKEIADRAAAFGASYHLRFAVGFHSIASEKPPAFGDQINA